MPRGRKKSVETPDKVALAQRLYRQGRSAPNIAECIGVSTTEVYRWLEHGQVNTNAGIPSAETIPEEAISKINSIEVLDRHINLLDESLKRVEDTNEQSRLARTLSALIAQRERLRPPTLAKPEDSPDMRALADEAIADIDFLIAKVQRGEL